MTLDGLLSHNLHSYWFRQTYLVRILEIVMERWWNEQFEGKKWHLSHLSLSADQHCERWWQTLLLPTLHLCRGHREHPTGVQRLPGHHPENAPAAVRTLVMGAFVGPPPFYILEELFLFFLLLLLNPSATPDRPSCQGLWSTTEVCQIFLVYSSFFSIYSPSFHCQERKAGEQSKPLIWSYSSLIPPFWRPWILSFH